MTRSFLPPLEVGRWAIETIKCREKKKKTAVHNRLKELFHSPQAKVTGRGGKCRLSKFCLSKDPFSRNFMRFYYFLHHTWELEYCTMRRSRSFLYFFEKCSIFISAPSFCSAAAHPSRDMSGGSSEQAAFSLIG